MMDRSSTLFAVWLPEPLTVATWMLEVVDDGFHGKFGSDPLAWSVCEDSAGRSEGWLANASGR